MAWTEVTHVVARRFMVGGYPWTTEEFYEYSCPLDATPPPDADSDTTITITAVDMEVPRVASRHGWWDDEYIWWCGGDRVIANAVDGEMRLVCDVWRFDITPLVIGDSSRRNMLTYECTQTGIHDVFEDHAKSLAELCAMQLDIAPESGYLVAWSCDGGKDPDTPNGPGEYWSEWEPLYIFHP